VSPTLDQAPDRPAGHRSSHFLEATRAIFSVRDPERLPEMIVSASAQAMEAETVSLLLPQGDGTLRVAHASGIPPEVQASTRIVVGEGIAGRVAASLTPLVLNGAAPGGHGRSRSAIIYPLVAGGALAGILTINRTGNSPDFGEDDLESVAVLASLILLALDNVRLLRQNTAAEKLAAVGQLAGGMAHEINTPIQFVGDSIHFAAEAMNGLIQLVERYRQAGERARRGEALGETLEEIQRFEEDLDVDYLIAQGPKALDRSRDGLRRVAEIVEAVKAFSRAEIQDKQVADVNDLLHTCSVVARPQYRDVAELEFDAGNVGPVLCHPGDLNQVFLNLLVNAAHAIADVVEKTGQRGLIRIGTRRDGPAIVVDVTDTGGGIPASVRDRIFEPFFTTKPVGKGTGLGLAVARTIIVDKHGGALSFVSTPGKGTKFTVRLPINGEPASPGRPAPG
jgi:signal transduction histidine kinase